MYSQTSTAPSCLFFANLSNADKLWSVKVKINDQQQPEAAQKTRPQIMKCRELIFTEPLVIASPCLLEDGFIYVVTHQDYWNTAKLQEHFRKMELQFGDAVPVTNAVLQACLSYTLRAKLAPLWNKSGDIYIQGRDFLSSSTRCNAIRLELTVSKGEICLAVRPIGVRMPTFRLQDFQICSPVLNYFFKSKDYVIQEFSIDDKWCHILPSMKKGKMVNITHTIPETSPFKSFKDIRRYWKNTYGYRLPEDEEGTVYCNIHFPAIGPMLFTYPHWCVRKFDVNYLPRVDHESVLHSFMMDVQKKVGSLCGCQMVLTTKPSYPVKGVQEVSSQNFQPTTANLTATPTILPRSVRSAMTRNGEVQQSTRFLEMNRQNTHHENTSQQIDNNTQETLVSRQTNSQPVHKVIPLFRPKPTMNIVPRLNQQEGSSVVNTASSQPIIPSFKPARRSATSDTLQKSSFSLNNTTNNHSTIPLFKPAKKSVAPVTPQQSHLVNRQSLTTRVAPSFQRMSSGGPPTGRSLAPTPHKIAPSFQRPSSDRPLVGTARVYTPYGNAAGVANPGAVISSKAVKRKKVQVDDKSSTPKKPREKPKVQENVDIQKLALENKLSKVNALTLSVWLKQKGIAVKSKDKKLDLVAKVINYIKIPEE